MRRTLAAGTALGIFTALLTVLTATPAQAFKPYTHVKAAQPALADVQDDGRVTVDGREYAVRPAVVQALRDWPSYYQAGVIGPDGFPDLTFGQSTIHPEQTGKWIGFLMDRAWAAQTDPRYGAAERGQILAFTYGFATHAAGDMWAHTFVNDFAEGIFPSVGDIVTDVDKAEIAIRHLIVEGYIGDATPGYDGNPDRQPQPDGDVSNDSTPGIAFDAPKRFLYDTLVDPSRQLPVGRCGDGLDDDGDGTPDDGCPGGPFTVGDPEPVRGPLIDYFLDLKSDLQIELAVARSDKAYDDCALIDWDCYERTATVTVDTVRGQRSGTYTRNECIGATIGCAPDPFEAGDDIVRLNIVIGYLDAWIDDIDDGLREWAEVGLGSTRALFDAQALRDTQNDECDHLGSETNPVRESCEDGIGATDVLFHELDPFINDHMLSMLGAPDALGDIRSALQWFADVLDDILGPALNPLRVVTEEIKEFAKDLVKKELNRALGIDIDLLSSFLKHPTYWLDAEQVSLPLGPLGTRTLDLFGPEDHEKLDELMGLPADHHENRTIRVPGGGTVLSSELKDDAEFSDLAIFDNAVTTSKLVLLDAGGLNAVARDQLRDGNVVKPGAAVSTWSDHAGRPANVMVDGLGGVEWLTTIDGDHAWRQDGMPRFAPGENPEDPHGGAGTFPLWESCLLRPAFRTLYEDWETDPTWWPKLAGQTIDHPNFPALGDQPSSDPSDTQAPTTSAYVGGGATYDAPDGTHFVGPGSHYRVEADDDVFAAGGITLETRVYREGATPGGWQPTTIGAEVPLSGLADGRYVLEARAGDPCHAVGTGTVTSTPFVVDTTPPAISILEPAPEGVVHDTDDLFSTRWSADDGPDGSGVASTSGTLDGAATTDGQGYDAFLLDAGLHALRVTATDNLGNTGDQTRTFRVRATAASLLSNVVRACEEGLITSNGACRGLQAGLRAAIDSHDRGAHRPTEVNQLGAVLHQLDAHLERSIDPVFGARFRGWVTDLVASH
jgi:hypothetical protein